ncbi:MAG: hypothetical protein ACRD36_04975, partial [Candidatus Acidiferrum sp.]
MSVVAPGSRGASEAIGSKDGAHGGEANPGARASALAPSVFLLAACATLIHFLFNGGYGYFRDELYYAACGEHLAWGFFDHAP